MADIHIEREHALGLLEARKMAFIWVAQAEKKFDMTCSYEQGAGSDLVSFSRTGVQGTLAVTTSSFDIDIKLGFLMGAFKGMIETEIARNLDKLIDTQAGASIKTA
ncbi:MAG: polyhydroxyalkanoic acid synthase [Polaromonas sp.]|nr:polyhydroxyalkanoic acid synthase [Polaromonas sp.]